MHRPVVLPHGVSEDGRPDEGVGARGVQTEVLHQSEHGAINPALH